MSKRLFLMNQKVIFCLFSPIYLLLCCVYCAQMFTFRFFQSRLMERTEMSRKRTEQNQQIDVFRNQDFSIKSIECEKSFFIETFFCDFEFKLLLSR